jgi:general secretion pathway protein N
MRRRDPLAALRRIRGSALVLATLVLAVIEDRASAAPEAPFESPPGPPAIVPVEHPGPPTRPAVADRPRAANPLWAVPLGMLSATRDRPIFSPTRRPPAVVAAVDAPPAKAAPPPAEPDHPLLTLVGTIVGGPTSMAVFLAPTTPDVIRLKTGQDYGGWVLRSVGRRETSFEKDRRIAVVALPPPDAPPSPGAPTPAAPEGARPDADGQVAERASRMAVSPPSRRIR